MTENIKRDSTQGNLKEAIGTLCLFVDLRAHFYVKRVEIDGIKFMESYVSMETKSLSCRWNIAVDGRVRARIGVWYDLFLIFSNFSTIIDSRSSSKHLDPKTLKISSIFVIDWQQFIWHPINYFFSLYHREGSILSIIC